MDQEFRTKPSLEEEPFIVLGVRKSLTPLYFVGMFATAIAILVFTLLGWF